MSSLVEHKLAAYNFCQFNYCSLFCVPSKLFPYLDKTLEYYQEAKLKKDLDRSWLTFANVNIKTMVFANYAIGFALAGNMDTSREYWEKALERAKKKKHLHSEQYVVIQLIILHFISGNTITTTEAFAIRELLKNSKNWMDLGFLIHTCSLIDNTLNPSEHKNLIPAMQLVSFEPIPS